MPFHLSSVFYLLLLLFVGLSVSSPRVNISDNVWVTGTDMLGYQTDKFEAFLGIPYALPPVGELRFSNPRPTPLWQGELKATTIKQDCIQKNYLMPTPLLYGIEDCLYLNVYRPIQKENQQEQLPVMVYIHGGGFFTGSASPAIHGPEYFMDTAEVIVVTIAYRLGALGFLSTGDGSMPGNFGLKDQNLALKWVQEHISAFGGNPQKVTIFGQSAGAVSVHFHMLSEASNGLFQQAIVMSGNAGAPYTVPLANPLEQARKTGELCNITNAHELSTAQLTDALRSIDAATLVHSGDGLKYWHIDPLTSFRPVIESPLSPCSFLTADPSEIIASGNYNQVPWMTGLVPEEGAVRSLSILTNNQLRTEFNERFDFLFEKLLEFPEEFSREALDQKVNRLVDYYLNGSHQLDDNTSQGFKDVISDRAFYHPYYQNIKQYVSNADTVKNPVFLYKFNYRGFFSYSMIYTGLFNNYGVVHCDDLLYLFKSPMLGIAIGKNSTDAAVIAEHVSTFVAFAKTGNPKGSDLTRPCNRETFNIEDNTICDYREISNDVNVGFKVDTKNTFNVEKVKLWEEILRKD